MGHFEEPGVLDFGQFSHMNSPVRSVVPSTQTAVEAAPELEVMTPFARWFTIIPNFWWLAPVFGIRCERVPEALSGWKWCPYLFRCLVGLQPKSCASFDPKNGGNWVRLRGSKNNFRPTVGATWSHPDILWGVNEYCSMFYPHMFRKWLKNGWNCLYDGNKNEDQELLKYPSWDCLHIYSKYWFQGVSI